MNTQAGSVEQRVTELEKNEAVNASERRHINTRLESLDDKVKDIGVKMDQGFKEVRETFAKPMKVAGGALVLAVIAWVIRGGLAI
tara:strand:- start:469 stop:723 length:255 start_codon:yes stop_codon:yes gene_type:complete